MSNVKIGKLIIIFIIVFVFLLLVICLNFGNKLNSNNSVNNTVNNQNKINNINKFILNTNCKDIKNRYTYIKSENEVIVGNNIQEVNNGFYDMCIINENNQIIIKLNKLFIDFNVDNIYDEEYLNNILIYLNNLINLDMDITTLKKYIIKYYIKSKDIHNVDNFWEEITISNYKIIFNRSNNELIITIKEG